MSQKSQSMEDIKIWSFNLFLRPPLIKTNKDDYKNQRFKIIIDRIDSFHIVCFQELFQTGTFRSEEMIAAGIRKGFHYWAVSQPTSFTSRPPVDSGLLVMSKFPIIKSQFKSFDIGVLSDSASDKGYIYCKIKINDNIVHLFNLHLQASYHTKQKDCDEKRSLSLATRRYQCKILKSEVTKILDLEYKDKDTVLIIGDFNMNALQQRKQIEKDSPFKVYVPEDFHEYEEFVALMQGQYDNEYILKQSYKVKDLLLQNHGFHPTTFGGEETMILTSAIDFKIDQRVDYVFHIQNNNGTCELAPILSQCVVEKGLVSGHPFTQLSDHFGIKLVLKKNK